VSLPLLFKVPRRPNRRRRQAGPPRGGIDRWVCFGLKPPPQGHPKLLPLLGGFFSIPTRSLRGHLLVPFLARGEPWFYFRKSPPPFASPLDRQRPPRRDLTPRFPFTVLLGCVLPPCETIPSPPANLVQTRVSPHTLLNRQNNSFPLKERFLTIYLIILFFFA